MCSWITGSATLAHTSADVTSPPAKHNMEGYSVILDVVMTGFAAAVDVGLCKHEDLTPRQ